MEEYISTTFNWQKFKEGSGVMAASNEDLWREYQAKLVQAGIEPEEDSNTLRAGVVLAVIMIAVTAVICWLWK